MSETQALLGKIAALRQRLEQAQGLVREADSAAAALAGGDGRRVEVLQRSVAAASEHDGLVDAALSPLVAGEAPAPAFPTQLTARARRVIERGRELLAQLRPLADDLEPEAQSPLRPEADFDTVRSFARDVATRLASRFPDELTVEPRKEQRGHRLYLDIMRNAYAQTVVAPYSVRGRPGAHVATPLHWSEVEDATLNPGQFTMRTFPAELERRGDPWAGMSRRRRRLPQVQA